MQQDQLILLLVGAGFAVVWLLAMVVILKRCLHIAGPHEILVISGRRRVLPDGRVVGFRILVGGRVLRIPFLERVDRMDATVMTVAFEVRRAYSRDGAPVDVSATATVKPCGAIDELTNFVERFLGRSREEIMRVARETLEGHVRAVIAMLTTTELNLDREKVAHDIREAAEADFSKLGLAAETLVLREVAVPPPARVPD